MANLIRFYPCNAVPNGMTTAVVPAVEDVDDNGDDDNNDDDGNTFNLLLTFIKGTSEIFMRISVGFFCRLCLIFFLIFLRAFISMLFVVMGGCDRNERETIGD